MSLRGPSKGRKKPLPILTLVLRLLPLLACGSSDAASQGTATNISLPGTRAHTHTCMNRKRCSRSEGESETFLIISGYSFCAQPWKWNSTQWFVVQSTLHCCYQKVKRHQSTHLLLDMLLHHLSHSNSLGKSQQKLWKLFLLPHQGNSKPVLSHPTACKHATGSDNFNMWNKVIEEGKEEPSEFTYISTLVFGLQ